MLFFFSICSFVCFFFFKQKTAYEMRISDWSSDVRSSDLLVVDAEGRQWLALGSFWSGIKLFALDPATGKPAPGSEPYSIARRIAPAGGPAAIEAPFIIGHGGW